MSEEQANSSHFPSPMQMVLLGEDIQIVPEKLPEDLSSCFRDVEIRVDFSSLEKGSCIIHWEQDGFMVMAINNPVPKESFRGALQTSIATPERKQIVDSQRAHLVISPLNKYSNLEASVAASIKLMKLSLAICRKAAVLGFYWSNSEVLVNSNTYIGYLKEIDVAMNKQLERDPNAGGHLPLTYWMGIRFFRNDNEPGLRAITQGFHVFTGHEVELTLTQWEPEKIAKTLLGVEAYVFSNGFTIEDGSTISSPFSEKLRVSFQRADRHFSQRFLLTPITESEHL